MLDNQLKLIDTKIKTLKEVSTHYDPKFIYTSAQVSHKLKAILKNKQKKSENDQKFGGVQESYKFKHHQIERETLAQERRQVTYQLKKKNYKAIKDLIKSKKEQKLNIIPDDHDIKTNMMASNSESKV